MLALLGLLPLCAWAGPEEEPIDTMLNLPQVVVTTTVKAGGSLRTQPVSSTVFNMRALERGRVESVKELSLVSPNLYIPDYGSRMTASVYVRGMGARIDNPVLGLNVDGIPYLNKNNFDFDFYDVQRVDVLRGPQSTLYGRNTMGGLVNIYTLSPFVWQGTRLGAEYGSANSMRFRASTYQRIGERLGVSAGAHYYHSDGFYTNEYDGTKCDPLDEGGARVRVQWLARSGWSIDNTLNVGVLNQGGYPYRYVDPVLDQVRPVSYNDECAYRRTNLSEGLSVRHDGEKVLFSSVASYQYTDDRMTLDQDFLPKSMFTLEQSQREHALTEDLVVRSRERGQRWNWLFGAFGFYKHVDMGAPVVFKEDGIRELILDNMNAGIQTVFPGEQVLIREKEFGIFSDFTLPTWGAALYHESDVRLGRWTLTAGVRIDYERSEIEYDSRADIHYRFTMTMPEYRLLQTRFPGHERTHFFEVLPRASVQYTFPAGNVYLSAAKGYKAGGFNTQLFSDLLQNRMMNDMMDDLGVHPDGAGNASYDAATAITYRPEYSWNYEAGLHLDLLRGRLRTDFSVFYIDCRDQQLTVFPAGKNTGRMMTNAGRTRSCGLEVAVEYVGRDLQVGVSYGHTNARFVRFWDGNHDYRGNVIPYAPQHTLSVRADYEIRFRSSLVDRLVLHADWRGVGRIYWNESNTLSQPFYGELGASIGVYKGPFSIAVWGRNLTDTQFDTFYFVSIGNSFLQRGKPARMGLTLTFDF